MAFNINIPHSTIFNPAVNPSPEAQILMRIMHFKVNL